MSESWRKFERITFSLRFFKHFEKKCKNPCKSDLAINYYWWSPLCASLFFQMFLNVVLVSLFAFSLSPSFIFSRIINEKYCDLTLESKAISYKSVNANLFQKKENRSNQKWKSNKPSCELLLSMIAFPSLDLLSISVSKSFALLFCCLFVVTRSWLYFNNEVGDEWKMSCEFA